MLSAATRFATAGRGARSPLPLSHPSVAMRSSVSALATQQPQRHSSSTGLACLNGLAQARGRRNASPLNPQASLFTASTSAFHSSSSSSSPSSLSSLLMVGGDGGAAVHSGQASQQLLQRRRTITTAASTAAHAQAAATQSHAAAAAAVVAPVPWKKEASSSAPSASASSTASASPKPRLLKRKELRSVVPHKLLSLAMRLKDPQQQVQTAAHKPIVPDSQRAAFRAALRSQSKHNIKKRLVEETRVQSRSSIAWQRCTRRIQSYYSTLWGRHVVPLRTDKERWLRATSAVTGASRDRLKYSPSPDVKAAANLPVFVQRELPNQWEQLLPALDNFVLMHRDVERTRIFELLKLTDQLAARQTPRRLALLRSLLKTLKHHQATVPTSSIFGVQFAGVMEALRSLPLARRSPALRRAISRLAHQPAVIEMAAAANIEPAHSAKTLRMAVDMVLGNVRQVQQMLRAPLSVVQKRLAELQGKPRTATFAKCDEIFAMLPSSAVVAHVMQRLTEGGMFKVAIDLHDAFVSTFASVTALAASTHNQSKTALLKFSTQQEACGLAMDMKTAIKVRRATDLLQTSTDRLKFMLASAPTNELLTPLLVALGHAQDASRVMVELTRYRTLFKAEPRMHLEAAAALALGGTPVRQALEVLPSLQALTSSTELVLSLLRCAVREHDLDSCARIIQGSGLVQLLETASTRSDLETIASSPPRNDLTAISRAMHDMHHVRNVDYLPGNASTSPSRQTLSAAVTEVIRAFRMALAYSVEAKPAMASHPALVAMSEAERELFSCLHKLTARAPNAAQQEQSPASVHALLQLSLSPPVLRAFGSAQASELLLTMPRSALSRLATSFVDISPAAVQQQLADAGLLPATVALLYHQAGRLIEESSQAAAATVAGLNARLHHHRPPQQDTSAMVTAIFSLVSTLYHQFTPLSSRKARTTGSSLQAHLQDSVAFATLATSLRMVMVAESRRFQSAVSRSADAALRLPLSSLSPSAIDTLLREGGSVEHLFSPIVDGATLGQIVPAPSEQSQLFDDCQLPLEPWRTNALAYPSHLFRTSYALAAVMTRTILPQIHWRVDAHRQMANTMIALHADAGSVVTAIRLTISALREGVQVQPHAFAAVLRATATVPSANPNSQRLAEIIVTHIWPSMNNAMQDVPHMSRPFLSAVTSPRFDQHVSTTKSSVASPHQPIAPPLAHAAALSPIKEAAAAPFNQTARTDTEPRPLLSSLAAAGASSFGPDRIDDLSLMQGVVTPGPAQSLGAVSTYVQRADVSLQLGRYAAGALGDFFKCCARINRPTEAYLASLSRQFDGALNPRIFDALLAGLNEANDAEGFAATLAYMHRCGVAIGLQAHLQIVKHYVATPAVADQMIHRLLSGTSVAVRVSGDASELTVAAQIAFASKAADSETAGSIPAAQQQPASPAARVSHELATADWYMDLVATGVSAWLRADQPSAAARLVLTSLPNLPSFVSRSALLTQLADLTSSTSASGRTFANELTLALCSNPMLVPARAVHTWQHHFEAQLSEETLAALARSRK